MRYFPWYIKDFWLSSWVNKLLICFQEVFLFFWTSPQFQRPFSVNQLTFTILNHLIFYWTFTLHSHPMAMTCAKSTVIGILSKIIFEFEFQWVKIFNHHVHQRILLEEMLIFHNFLEDKKIFCFFSLFSGRKTWVFTICLIISWIWIYVFFYSKATFECLEYLCGFNC